MLTGCAGEPQITLPPDGGTPDYQLGAAYPPPDGVEIVARARTASPPPGVYAICYINGFQTQPGEDWDDDLLQGRTAVDETRAGAGKSQPMNRLWYLHVQVSVEAELS